MMNQQRANVFNSTQFRNSPNIAEGITQPMGVPGVPSISPPPIPPRRPLSYQSYTPFNSYAGGYGYGSSWNNMNRYNNVMGYGSYPNYSMYGQNHWGGPSGDVENRFVQFAEESTRPAFQSIEAMVHTFSSVTMMLESTFFAMTSSFRAILGVAENMGKLRNMLKQLLSSFALVRFLKWLYLRIKYKLGLRSQDECSEILWRKTITEVMKESTEQNGISSWPIFIFLSILFVTPYLIHKLINNARNININVNNPKEWLQNKEPVFTATALYDFTAASPEEISLKSGQKIWLAPQSLQPKNLPGWCRATDTINVGLIPSSYVTIVGQLKKKSEHCPTETSNHYEPTVTSNNINIVKGHVESEEKCYQSKKSEDFIESKDENIFELKNEND